MRQHYILGREMRKRYIEETKLLDESYNAEQLLVRATGASRAIVSAQAQLSGLYPMGTGSRLNRPEDAEQAVPPNNHSFRAWMQELNNSAINHTYRTIPLAFVGGSPDYLMTPNEVCSEVFTMVSQFRSDHEAERKAKEAEYQPLYRELETAFGLAEGYVQNMYVALRLRDVLVCALWEGQYIKDERTTQRLVDATADLDRYLSYRFYFNVTDRDRRVSKILATSFLTMVNELLASVVQNRIEEKSTPLPLRFAMFVGHDTLMDALLMHLEINKGDILVPFAAVMLIELYRNQTRSSNTSADFYVRLIYGQEYESVIPLDEFAGLIMRNVYSMDTFQRYCFNIGSDTPTIIWAAILSILSAVFLVFATALFLFYRLKYSCTTNEDAQAGLAN